METMQLLLIAAAVAAACGALFVAWAATSDSREARVYRRKWKEFRLKNSKRNTSKYRGVGAGGGMHAASGGRGLRHATGAAIGVLVRYLHRFQCHRRATVAAMGPVAGTASERHRRGAPTQARARETSASASVGHKTLLHNTPRAREPLAVRADVGPEGVRVQ